MKSCFERNWITEGPKSAEFVDNLLELIGAKYGVLAPNGTLALYLGLKAIGVGRGDEVLVPDLTFIGSANAVEMVGAVPIFIDVNSRNFHIDTANADKFISEKTKAIMPVHLFGTTANMHKIMSFAKKHKLLIIEDSCQAINVRFNNVHAGNFGDVGAFSFFADKTITTGEGGLIVTNSEKIFNELLYLRNQGRKSRGTFIHEKLGYNFRMTDFQCAIGIEQLKRLKEITQKKIDIYNMYFDQLSDIKEIRFLELEKGAENVPFRTCILAERAHSLMGYMKKNNIEPRSFFYPLHKQPCYEYLYNLSDEGDIYKEEKFLNSIFAYKHGIMCPTYQDMTDDQINYTCKIIKNYYEKM